jgi:hypothetical protein
VYSPGSSTRNCVPSCFLILLKTTARAYIVDVAGIESKL